MLRWVIARLREHCPWTSQLTHEDLTEYLVEEAYEVLEEIEAGSLDEGLRKEMGDLLFQIALHAQLAQERGSFDLDGVAQAITAKLVRRSRMSSPRRAAWTLTPTRASSRSKPPGPGSRPRRRLSRIRRRRAQHQRHRSTTAASPPSSARCRRTCRHWPGPRSSSTGSAGSPMNISPILNRPRWRRLTRRSSVNYCLLWCGPHARTARTRSARCAAT
ncbi:MazG nucleotide pyrophosphohydrolase domain-containing protein [Nesterenkonia sp. AN1]|uniref:MazG nucleotide pyrophosphohydrolase domain-containing protein n=1 Tax=Nesterenkonia sp. AN1 TaxID=652017 RepID=UPI00350F03F3